jgi:hypothetical protein
MRPGNFATKLAPVEQVVAKPGLRPDPVAAALRERHDASSVRIQDAAAAQRDNPVHCLCLLHGIAAVVQAPGEALSAGDEREEGR